MLTIASALKYTSLDNFGLSENITSAALLIIATAFILMVNKQIYGNFFYIAPTIWGITWIAVANWTQNLYISSICICSSLTLMSAFVYENIKSRDKNIFRK
jgi:cell division protein FtsW (lipid II flippase)